MSAVRNRCVCVRCVRRIVARDALETADRLRREARTVFSASEGDGPALRKMARGYTRLARDLADLNAGREHE